MSSQALRLTIVKHEEDDIPTARYAQELRQAILDASPPGAKVSRHRLNESDMQLGEAIVIEVVTGLILKGIMEGINHFLLKKKKVRVQLEAGGKIIVVDEMKPELAAIYAELEKLLALPRKD